MGRGAEPTKKYKPLPFEDDINPSFVGSAEDMMTKEEEE